LLLRITNKRKVAAGSYQIHGHDLEQVKKAKYLGVTLDEKMSWKHYTGCPRKLYSSSYCESPNMSSFLAKEYPTTTNKETKLQCYKIFVRPTIMLKDLELQTLQQRRQIDRLKMLYSIHHGFKYLGNDLIYRQRCTNIKFKLIHGALQCYSSSFFPKTIRDWNELPPAIANLDHPNTFKNAWVNHIV